jgi:magnesium transporter
MRQILDGMTPDDQARLLEELPAEVTRRLLETLSPEELRAARDLLGYPPETAGRYMTPRYVALRPDMTAREALENVRRTGRGQETLNILYVLDDTGKLLEELRLGSLVMADPDGKVADIEDRRVVSIPATTNRKEVLRVFKKYDRVALPVTDRDGHMLGIITADDVLDVSEQEATEEIHKIGGMEALDAPYLDVGYLRMVWKRGGWLSALFLGEMLTATAMGHYEDELAKAIVLTMFIPLIISSGGNSGSQAATLIVRSLALTELRLRDWWRVFVRELRSGLTLGAWLGFIGFVRITVWQVVGWAHYTDHYLLVALTVWVSLIGVVTFGSLAGSMLPLVLRRLGFDPATSSAPFVATLVDVTGLVIYFTVALLILRGTLL